MATVADRVLDPDQSLHSRYPRLHVAEQSADDIGLDRWATVSRIVGDSCFLVHVCNGNRLEALQR